MIEALIALVLSILVLAVFSAPGWAIKLGAFGGLGFVFWVLILILEWLVGKVRSANP